MDMRVGIIGYGRIAHKHVEAIKANGDKLIAVCDVDPQRLTLLDETVLRFSDLESFLFQKIKLDLIAICTPSGTHAEIALKCIENGYSVLVEKPMALSISDADAIIASAKRYGVKVGVCHQNRFNLSAQILKKALQNQQLGTISHASIHVLWNRKDAYYKQASWRGTWAMDGGCLMNQCIHGIDFLLYMIDEEVTSVFGQIANRQHPDMEVEDVGMAIIQFCNGVIAIIEGTSNVYPENLEETFYIFGDQGTVKLGGLSLNEIKHWKVNQDESQICEEMVENEYGNGHQALYQDMKAAILDNRSPSIDAKEGKKALEVILAIYRSSREHRPVFFPLRQFSTLEMKNQNKIHNTATIDKNVQIGLNTKIWHYTHIQKNARIGNDCVIGQNVNIGPSVQIHDRVKIQNNVSVYEGVELHSDVFCGPSVVFTNVKKPRSSYPKQNYEKTIVHQGASLGANATIICPRQIGKWSFIGAGSVVTKDVLDYALMAGNPARQIGWVCECGERLNEDLICPSCHQSYVRTGMNIIKKDQG